MPYDAIGVIFSANRARAVFKDNSCGPGMDSRAGMLTSRKICR